MGKDKRNLVIQGALSALGGHPLKSKQSIEAIGFPAVARVIFSCKRCDKGFPLDEGVRTLLSADQARETIAAFSKDLEPRTIACSCGHEDEYRPEDVGLFVLPEEK
jgi:hypothetical protein